MKRETFESGSQKRVEEMPQDKDEQLKKTQSRFKLKMSVLMLAGVLIVFGAVVWKHEYPESKEKLLILQIGQSMPGGMAAGSHSPDGSVALPTKSLADLVTELITESNQQYGLGADLLRDLGIALVISVIATVVIEKYSSDRLREHIAYDVLSAAYAKVVPEKIYTQVADNVFRSEVYRRNWEVHINTNAQQFDRAGGIAIITAIYSYNLQNLNDHKISYRVSGGIDLDVPLPDKDIPRFKSIAITDEHNRPLVLDQHIKALLAKQKELTYSEDNLSFKRDAQELRFAAQVSIPALRYVTVRFQVERAIRVPGNYVLNTPVPTAGIKIILKVEGFKLGVLALHPRVLDHPQDDTWEMEAGILPWQGFRFTSEV